MRRLVAANLLLTGLVLLAGCGRKLDSSATRDLLRQVHQAWRATAVSGRVVTTVMVKDQLLTAEAQVHRGPDIATMAFLSGKYQGWKVIEEDGLVWRVDPQGRPRRGQGMGGARPGLPPGLHDMTVERSPGWRRVAGRRATRYVISPPGKSKARLVLDLDSATGFPLASRRYSTQGKPISSTVFRELELGGPPPERVPVPPVAQGRSPLARMLKTRPATEAELAKALGGELLKPTRLPQGLTLSGSYLSQTPRGDIAELRYSDGLRLVTLLQTQARRRDRPRSPEVRGPRAEGPRHRERRNWLRWPRPGAGGKAEAPPWRQALRSRLRGHVVREQRGDWTVILAGDLSPEELQDVMDSVPQPGTKSVGTTRTSF